MAVDWDYEPQEPYDVKPIGPMVLKTALEDGTEDIRLKSSTVKREFTERYKGTAADTKTKLDYWDTVGTHTTFTKNSYDPQSATPSSDSVTVRFVGDKPRVRWSSNPVDVVFKFREA